MNITAEQCETIENLVEDANQMQERLQEIAETISEILGVACDDDSVGDLVYNGADIDEVFRYIGIQVEEEING